MANPRTKYRCRRGTILDLGVGTVLHTHKKYGEEYKIDHVAGVEFSRWLLVADAENGDFVAIYLPDGTPTDLQSWVKKTGLLNVKEIAPRMQSGNISVEVPA